MSGAKSVRRRSAASRRSSRSFRIKAWKLDCDWGVYQPVVVGEAEVEIRLLSNGTVCLRPICGRERGPAVVVPREKLSRFLRRGGKMTFSCLLDPARKLVLSTAGNGEKILFIHFPEEDNGGKYRTFTSWVRSCISAD
ncbi:MAG TPA: hypothetical protein EYP14_07840 [Planctomycetaceae bacterium]|nr:hypothetical protein [Planctomycetaceae bacterium]